MRLGALCVALGFVGCSLGQGAAPKLLTGTSTQGALALLGLKT